jgi:hypothetical protein
MIGMSNATVSRELAARSRVTDVTPDLPTEIAGSDGKTYPRPQPIDREKVEAARDRMAAEIYAKRDSSRRQPAEPEKLTREEKKERNAAVKDMEEMLLGGWNRNDLLGAVFALATIDLPTARHRATIVPPELIDELYRLRGAWAVATASVDELQDLRDEQPEAWDLVNRGDSGGFTKLETSHRLHDALPRYRKVAALVSDIRKAGDGYLFD